MDKQALVVKVEECECKIEIETKKLKLARKYGACNVFCLMIRRRITLLNKKRCNCLDKIYGR